MAREELWGSVSDGRDPEAVSEDGPTSGGPSERMRLTSGQPRRYDTPYTRAPNDLAIVAIIPARFGSTRLPGKPLSEIHGKPMIQHVHERVSRARRIDRVLVATEDERIAEAVRGFGGEAVMTSPDHATGTDRLAEAAREARAEIVVNVQGDEPMIDPAWIDAAVEPLLADARVEMGTLSLPFATWRRCWHLRS